MPVISVGIDVSKGKSTVCILKSAGEVIAVPYEAEHTQDGMRKFTDFIQDCKEEVRVILEATGPITIGQSLITCYLVTFLCAV